jgi:hypothetical protein
VRHIRDVAVGQSTPIATRCALCLPRGAEPTDTGQSGKAREPCPLTLTVCPGCLQALEADKEVTALSLEQTQANLEVGVRY